MTTAAGNPAVPTDLRVAYDPSPDAVPTDAVRFSWQCATDRQGARQTAYRLRVGTTGAVQHAETIVWDSGRVDGDRAVDIAYGGPPLEAGTTYHWSVCVWDERGERSAFAEPRTFRTAPASANWTADWITHQPGVGDTFGYRSEWHAPDGDDEWVQIALGEQQSIEGVTLHPATLIDRLRTPDGIVVTNRTSGGGQRGFGFPEAVRVELRDEAGTTAVVERAFDERPTEAVTVDIEGTGRSVRVTATEPYRYDPTERFAGEPGLFADEALTETLDTWAVFALAGVTVHGTASDDVAAGQPVTARTSATSEGWGAEHLTNGVTASQAAATAPRIGTTVTLDAPVEDATLYAATLGWGEVYCNGERVGDRVLDPAWTEYDERVLYTTDDVTDRLSEGENALGVWLGRGWFGKSPGLGVWAGFGSPRALVRLEVTLADGTERVIESDDTWLATDSPITANDIYDGERYDARRETPDWATTARDEQEWANAAVVDGPDGRLSPQRLEPMRVVDSRQPVDRWPVEDGVVLDFGANVAGRVELTLTNPAAGHEVTVEHAETLADDGSLSTDSLRSAAATDTYIARGDDEERYAPRFTYHGFRYVRVTGVDGATLAGSSAQVINSDMAERSEFACSSETLTALQDTAVRGLRGTMHGVPEDCPQRDERFGWTGDHRIAGAALLYNFDAARFQAKWLRDHRDAQAANGTVGNMIPHSLTPLPGDPTWSVTQVTIPWLLYRHGGSEGVLERHYASMCRYVEYWQAAAEDGILGAEWSKYGDWFASERPDDNDGQFPHSVGPFALFNTAYQYHAVRTLARASAAIDHDDDAARYDAMADAMAAAFNDRFFDPERGTYEPKTQSANAVALFFDLVPDGRDPDVAATLAEQVREAGGALQTGYIGTRPLVLALSEHGYADLAYEMVTRPDAPSWGYMLEQGATTFWEHWHCDEEPGSLNHQPFTFVSEWLFEELAGIDHGADGGPGTVHIEPRFVDALEWVRAEVETRHGTVAAAWERTEEGYRTEVTIPWNTTGRLVLPTAGERAVLVDGQAVAGAEELPPGTTAGETGDETTLTLESGEHVVNVTDC
jgi:alpha-L-rhamnosidase